MQTQKCFGTGVGTQAQLWFENQQRFLYKVCGGSSGSPAHPSASQGEAVPDVGSAEAPQHQEKKVHNMGMDVIWSYGHTHEFYGSFTLPEYPKVCECASSPSGWVGASTG